MKLAAMCIRARWAAVRGSDDTKERAKIGAELRYARRMMNRAEFSAFKRECRIKGTSWNMLINATHPEVEEL